jgi:hypothetical protein
MTISFAYLDQAWGDDQKKFKSEVRKEGKPRRKAYNKVYDDIIDTYIGTDNTEPSSYASTKQSYVGRSTDHYKSDQRNINPAAMEIVKKPIPVKQPEYEALSGHSSSELLTNSLDFDRFYSDDNMFPGSQKKRIIPPNRQVPIDEEEYPVYSEQQDAIDDSRYIRMEDPGLQVNTEGLENHEEMFTNQYLDDNSMIGDVINNNVISEAPQCVQQEQENLPKFYGLVELALFVFAGVLFIFMLEQFVQLGVYLR